MAQSKKDTLIAGLRNAYALESQALATLDNVQNRLYHYPEFKEGVQQHLEETRQQQKLVEECLQRFDQGPSALKETTGLIAGNMQAMLNSVATDAVLKNLFALYSFEHLEIATYRSLITMAEACGEGEVADTCRKILGQEETAASKLERLIEPVSNAYLEREADASVEAAS